MSPASGTMKARRSGVSASSGRGGSFSRKLAITPSRKVAVVPVARTVSRKGAVSRRSANAIEPPRTNITKITPMPPM